MAITHRAFVLLTFPLCCASIAILATALATQNWLVATSVYENPDPQTSPNNINYGLFVGTLVSNIFATPRTYELYMTCLADRNICALSCLATHEERRQQVSDLHETGTSDDDCVPVTRTNSAALYQTEKQLKDTSRVNALQSGLGKFDIDQRFINMGLWASTIAFIAVALLFAVLGAVFSVLNTAGNPVEPILGILGLFIWNGVAACAICLTLVLWGIQFGTTLTYNAVLDETISGDTTSSGRAALGYSYWILIGAEVAHLVNIGLLFYRRHLILTEPPAPTIQLQEDPDGAIFLY